MFHYRVLGCLGMGLVGALLLQVLHSVHKLLHPNRQGSRCLQTIHKLFQIVAASQKRRISASQATSHVSLEVEGANSITDGNHSPVESKKDKIGLDLLALPLINSTCDQNRSSGLGLG